MPEMAAWDPSKLRVEARGLHGVQGRSQVSREILLEHERAAAIREEPDRPPIRQMRRAAISLDEPDQEARRSPLR